MSSPTQRTLAEMRKRGYVCDVVEKWIPQIRQRKDLFGFIDVIALGDNIVIGIQATSDSNVASRIRKIADHPKVGAVRRAGIALFVHGWSKRRVVTKRGRKSKRATWHLREIDVS